MVRYCESTATARSSPCSTRPQTRRGDGHRHRTSTTTAALEQLSSSRHLLAPREGAPTRPERVRLGRAAEGSSRPRHRGGVFTRTDSAQPGGVHDPPAGIGRAACSACSASRDRRGTRENKARPRLPAPINPLTTGQACRATSTARAPSKVQRQLPYDRRASWRDLHRAGVWNRGSSSRGTRTNTEGLSAGCRAPSRPSCSRR